MTQSRKLGIERFRTIGDWVDEADFKGTGPLAGSDFGNLLAHVLYVHGVKPTVSKSVEELMTKLTTGDVGVSSNNPEVLEILYAHLNDLHGKRITMEEIIVQTEAARPQKTG